MGGENPQKEKARLRKGINIVIATPGRLLYHLQNTQCFTYDKLEFLVFEEADTTLAMGFKNDIDKILQILMKKLKIETIQKILIASSFNTKVEMLSLDLSKEKMRYIGFSDNNTNNEEECIVFVATIDEVEFFENLFNKLTYNDSENKQTSDIVISQEVYKLHGNIEQKQRSDTYFKFKNTTNGAVLISTEVCARGLDFNYVKHIILFDPPNNFTEYANKIGRTARINQKGISLLFLLKIEVEFIEEMKKNTKAFVIEEFSKDNCLTFLRNILENKYSITLPANIYFQSLLKTFNNNYKNNLILARKAYNSFLKYYTRLTNKKIFNIKEINLLYLSKCFGLQDTKTKENEKDKNNQNYLKRRNEKKYENPGIERKIIDVRKIQKMEFL